MKLHTNSSLGDFQAFLADVYGEANAQLTFEYMLCYLPRTCGYLFKKILDKRVSSSDFVKCVAWLFAISNKLGGNLEASLVSRFPGVCPHCLLAPCACLRTGKKPPHYIPAYKVLEELQAKCNVVLNSGRSLSFSFFAENSRSIYPSNEIIWTFAGPSFHFAKIQEEIAEIHEAYSAYCLEEKGLDAVMAEVADVLAWVLSAWTIALREQSPADEMISIYLRGCPVCTADRCRCKPYHSRSVSLLSEAELLDIREDLEGVRKNGAHADRVDEALQSLMVAATSQDDPISHLAIDQARELLLQITTGSLPDATAPLTQAARSAAQRLLNRLERYR